MTSQRYPSHEGNELYLAPENQFGTQVEFRRSRDHNNQAADNAFSAMWHFSEMELEPVTG